MSNLCKEDKILIAGANGMVGRAINRILINSGYGAKNLYGELYTPSRKELNYLNYSEVEDWFNFYKPNIVIIAAAKVGGIFANNNFPADFLMENLIIQTNLINIAWKKKVRKLIFLGSSCIYPKFSKQPILEEYLLSGSLEKTNESYALAKIAGIKLCQSLRKQYNFDAISLMPSNLYGPFDNYNYESSHVLPALIRKFSEAKEKNEAKVVCWGTGNPFREFLHVDDLADATLFLLNNWNSNINSSSEIMENSCLNWINVGTGKEVSIKELAETIKKEIGYEGDIEWDITKPDGTPKKLLCIEKLKSLGWNYKINLNDGIRKTINSFLEEKEKGILRK